MSDPTRRRIGVSVVALAVAGAGLWWWERGARRVGRVARPAPGSVPSTHALDVAALRQALARRREAIAAVRARHPGPGRDRSTQAMSGLLTGLTTPRCILGPATLCDDLGDTVLACEDGDASACLAVGQYLQDEPPRPVIAIAYFVQACRLGDALACARERDLNGNAPMTAPCEDDPVRCALAGMRIDGDPALLERACAAGVADACGHAYVLLRTAATAAPAALVRERGYLERGCQLGNPMMCAELGRRLSPSCGTGCKPGEDCAAPCFPVDPAAAATALEMACLAGFAEACDRRDE
ncbi:MAG: hypothetical protein R3B06_15660 [Kofleriaceae bacterium]